MRRLSAEQWEQLCSNPDSLSRKSGLCKENAGESIEVCPELSAGTASFKTEISKEKWYEFPVHHKVGDDGAVAHGDVPCRVVHDVHEALHHTSAAVQHAARDVSMIFE